MRFLTFDRYADDYEEIIMEAYYCGYEAPVDTRSYCYPGYFPIDALDRKNYLRLIELNGVLMSSIDNDWFDIVKDVKRDFDRDCRYVSDIIKDAIDKLKYNYPDMEDIIELLPQETVHGINAIIDKIMEVKNASDSWCCNN